MKTSTANFLPVFPSYITSLPVDSKPLSVRILLTSSGVSPANAVPSAENPLSEAALPEIDSMNCPTVIRDGNACGLMMTSGTTPSAV